MGLYSRLVSFVERIRPGFLVPKGVVFEAEIKKDYRILVPEIARKKLRLSKGEVLDVFVRLEPLRLNPLQRIAYRIRPGIFFPKGYHFTAKIDEDWRLTIPKKLISEMVGAGRPFKEGDEIEVYIRRYSEAI